MYILIFTFSLLGSDVVGYIPNLTADQCQVIAYGYQEQGVAAMCQHQNEEI